MAAAARVGKARCAGARRSPREPWPACRTFTYAQAETCVDAIAGVFASLGLAPGDRIAVQLANTAIAPLTLLAAWRAGLTVIALPFLWRRYEVATIAADLKPQALLGAGSFDGFSIAHGLREVAAKEMSVRFVLGFGADLPDGVAPLDALLDVKRSVVAPAEPRDLPGAALVTFTARAGAAFVPVAYTEDELLAHGMSAAKALSLDRGETILNPFPISSAAGIGFALMPWLVSGCKLLQHEPFDLDAFAAQLIEQGATLAALPVPLIAAFAATGVTTDVRCKLTRMGQVWSPAQAVGGSAANLPLFDIHPREDGGLPELSLGSTNASPYERDPELLRHGGFAIAASELNALYKTYPGFLDAACFAVPCPIMGDRIHAAVVAKPAQSISREALCAFLARQGVAPYKYPERLVVMKSIPRDAQGRVLREELLRRLD
jgi:acyl-CoA synthetase (AMP-forming)/AMP-acid ligase II